MKRTFERVSKVPIELASSLTPIMCTRGVAIVDIIIAMGGAEAIPIVQVVYELRSHSTLSEHTTD